MAEDDDDGPGLGDRISGAVDRARAKVGVGGPPSAKNAEGRVATVRQALLAFGEGDLDRFFETFAEDVEWVAPRGESFPAAGKVSGRDDLREELTGAIKQSYASFGFRADQYLLAEREDWVVMLGTFIGEPVHGKDLEVPGVQVWEFDGDEVSRVRLYADSAAFPEPRTDEQREEDHQQAEDDGEEAEDESHSEGEHQAQGEAKDESHSEGEHQAQGEAKAESHSEGEHQAQGEAKAESHARGEADGEGPEAKGERAGGAQAEAQGEGAAKGDSG